jgi:hypothetical protein
MLRRYRFELILILLRVIMIIKSEPYENTIDGTALKWE